MKFLISMALREMRRGRRKFMFFLLCIAIGVAALVGVKGFNASLQAALLREARQLMAADMKVSMSQQATPEQEELLRSLSGQGIQVAHLTETNSMVLNPANQETALVEVKAIEPGYPFYGALVVNPPAPLSAETLYAGSDLMDRLGLKVGDPVRLGHATFAVAGVIEKEPDRVAAGFSFGSRVMVNREGLDRARLIQFGSRAREVFLLKLASDEQVEPVREQLKAAFEPTRGRTQDFREAEPRVRRFLDRMTGFLALVSMVALLVGGLGVANAARVFIQQKLDSIAVMKCLGATNRRIVLVYLVQMGILSLGGSLLGVLAGYGIQLVMPRIVGTILEVQIDLALSPVVAVQGLTVGLLTAVLFTLLPLTAIADVKPALVFRREMLERRPPMSGRRKLQQGLLAGGIALGLALISSWVSGRPDWGFWFTGGLIVAVGILWGAAYYAVRLVRRLNLPRAWVTARQGLANLYRPGSQAAAVVLALGIGVTMVLAVYLLQRALTREARIVSPAGAPNMFFQGIQPSEIEDFESFLKTHPGVESAPEPIPIVRGRLLQIDKKGKEELRLSESGQRWFDFQFSLTFSDKLPAGNELLEGRWWTQADYGARRLISVEEEAARNLKIRVGSVVEMNLEGGAPVRAEVFNIRRTTDFRAGGGFNFVFAPGGLEGVPVTYLGQARVLPHQAGALQREAVRRYPAALIINLQDVLQTVGDLMDRITLVIRFVAAFSVAAGLIILASSIAATKFRRTREAALYKTLGAVRGRVWRIFATEYAVLGLVAGLVGAALSSVVAWLVLKHIMEVKFQLEPGPLLAGVVLSVLLTVGVGVLSTLDVMAAKPLQVLREE